MSIIENNVSDVTIWFENRFMKINRHVVGIKSFVEFMFSLFDNSRQRLISLFQRIWFDSLFIHHFNRIEWYSAWCWLWCDQIWCCDWFKHRERSRNFSDRFRFWDLIDQSELRFSFRVRHEWLITEHNIHNCCCLIKRADSWRIYWWK
jgi:hypothetical protein